MLKSGALALNMDEQELKELIIQSLRDQGFVVEGDRLLPPHDLTKDAIRSLHSQAALHKIERSKEGLARHEPRLLKRIATGQDLDIDRIHPVLVEVQPDTEDELLFRYVGLHWSVPVSSGYGRRLRFLVMDSNNEKLIGICGLGDPVFSLAPRDKWVGWTKADRTERLHHVMSAFVLGAVPPYSFLLCGKLVALLAASVEVRDAFRKKYGGRLSLIRQRSLAGELALVTTTSALGRSSLYNRLHHEGRRVYQRVGFTQGSGEFHFSNGLYAALSKFAEVECDPTAKHDRWGTGFRSRREIVRKSLVKAGLSPDWLYHGIKREIFVAPLASNAQRFLRGEDARPEWFASTGEDIFRWFRERWLLPRSQRDESYKVWDPDNWVLWGKGTAHG